MTTEYRFCLTPRLIALGFFSGLTLMVLLFALGYLIGQQMAPERPMSDAEHAADEAGRRAMQKFDKAATGAIAPLAAPAKAAQKALP